MQHSEYILIHPQLWVNWTGADPLPNETDSIQLEISVTVKAPIVEKARIVQVAMIKSMHYSTKSECAKSLAEFFSTPRLVYLDDVFCVNQDRDETEITVEIGIQEENSPKRWFKVADIVKEAAAQDREMLEDSIISKGPFWVHTNHSTLYQMPDSNAFVPQMSIDTSEENLVFGPFGDSIPSFFMELVLKLQQRSIASRRMGSALSVLIHGPAGSGKELIASCLALTLHMNICVVDCYQLWSETPGTAEAKLKNLFDKCMDNSPCLLLLKNIEVLGKDPNTGEPDSRITAFLQSSFERIKQAPLQVIIFGTSTVFREVPIDLLALFGEEIKIKNLTLKDRSSLLSALCNLSESELAVIAERTPGFVAADLISLVEELKNPIASGSNPMEKLSSCLDEMQTDYGDSIGAPKIPDVAWEDVGGLEDAKKAILDTIESGKLNLVNSDLKRSGVLLHGPPGCGKTLLAKAVASQCKLTFLSVKGPELLNMYVGQSEHNVRDVFEKARAASPCIIFFDELDALAPNRGKSGDSGGVMDRVVSQLLAELDGVQENQDLFVIGATNRPDLVDPSLLRPGRFDKSIYVGLNGDRKSQRKVLDALLRKLPIDDAVEPQLDGIISTLPTDVSGADIYSLVAQASAKAIGREIARVQAGEIQEEEGRFKILLNDLEDASMEMFVR